MEASIPYATKDTVVSLISHKQKFIWGTTLYWYRTVNKSWYCDPEDYSTRIITEAEIIDTVK